MDLLNPLIEAGLVENVGTHKDGPISTARAGATMKIPHVMFDLHGGQPIHAQPLRQS